ncbi:uncharacterized protein [Lolium perenne]|uniref:uncharacterized protein n=1 Tax=Lolium perenne TaxID=4522 RepID=UPI0021F68B6E|nr:uncharacterized protein LOC127298474 [Lolium perenne]
MYGEIAAGLVNQFMEKMKQGKVYELRRYKTVRRSMIISWITPWPVCTYALTPIDDLPSLTDNPESSTGTLTLEIICIIHWFSDANTLLKPVTLKPLEVTFNLPKQQQHEDVLAAVTAQPLPDDDDNLIQ